MRCKSPKPLSAAHLIRSNNVSKSGEQKQNIFTLASLFLSRGCVFFNTGLDDKEETYYMTEMGLWISRHSCFIMHRV